MMSSTVRLRGSWATSSRTRHRSNQPKSVNLNVPVSPTSTPCLEGLSPNRAIGGGTWLTRTATIRDSPEWPKG
jgi:hypothetical protein